MTVLAKQPQAIQQAVVVPAGGALIGQEYFRIVDQAGETWYWWIDSALVPDWSFAPPDPFEQERRFFIVPYWVKLADEGGTAWYLYPEVDGSALIETARPATGNGMTGSPKLRVRGGPLRYQYTIVGGSLDVVAA